MTATAQRVLDGSAARPAAHRIPLAEGWSLWRPVALRSAGMPISWLEPFAAPESGGADDARAVSAAAVRNVVAQPAFLEAVTWQNPAVVRNWLGRYAAEVAAGGRPQLARRDQREALVAL